MGRAMCVRVYHFCVTVWVSPCVRVFERLCLSSSVCAWRGQVQVKVVDANGAVVPDASDMVTFSVSGPATIAGTANGDPACHVNNNRSVLSSVDLVNQCCSPNRVGSCWGFSRRAVRPPSRGRCCLREAMPRYVCPWLAAYYEAHNVLTLVFC